MLLTSPSTYGSWLRLEGPSDQCVGDVSGKTLAAAIERQFVGSEFDALRRKSPATRPFSREPVTCVLGNTAMMVRFSGETVSEMRSQVSDLRTAGQAEWFPELGPGS